MTLELYHGMKFKDSVTVALKHESMELFLGTFTASNIDSLIQEVKFNLEVLKNEKKRLIKNRNSKELSEG